MQNAPELPTLRLASRANSSQYQTEFDPDNATLWGFFNPHGNPCFSPSFLHDIRAHDQQFEENKGLVAANGQWHQAHYYVAGSRVRGVFNLGGDLALFQTLIRARDRDALLHYGKRCIDCVYPRVRNYHVPGLITISLVQGDALGGGFETALSSDLIIAEEGVTMGLPEILFNLFPGMGAYSLLSRKIGMKKAEELILSGRMYSAGELYELGVIDVLAPQDGGKEVTQDWIHQNRKRRNGMQAVFSARREVHPILRSEMDAILHLWVDAALKLEERDLKMMKRLVSAQARRAGNVGEDNSGGMTSAVA